MVFPVVVLEAESAELCVYKRSEAVVREEKRREEKRGGYKRRDEEREKRLENRLYEMRM